MKIAIVVKPNAKESVVEKVDDGSLVVRLKAVAIERRANEELIKVLAKYFGVTQRDVLIKSGVKSRKKIVEIAGR